MQQHLAETHKRTLARATTYRIMAVISSLAMVGIASGILVEVSKTMIYYVLERLWLHLDWQLVQGRETHVRILARAVVYRVMATVAATYWVGIEAALTLAVIQTLLFYFNDLVWQRISWGETVATG